MSINKGLKKLFICSTSLVMIAGLGSGISNASAKRAHHTIKTSKVAKGVKHGKRVSREHAKRINIKANHKRIHNRKKHLSYYSKGYRLGKEDLENHSYESVSAWEEDPMIMGTIYKSNMNKQLIHGLINGLHAHIRGAMIDLASTSIKYDIRAARKLSHQRGPLARKGINDTFDEKTNKKYRHNKTYMKAHKLAYKLMDNVYQN